jgi:macrodomain Ter protein organizer (MatP/YcbG family)
LEERLWNRLHLLAKQSGTTLSELVRQAVRDKYLMTPLNRKQALREAAGLWRDRGDLVDTETHLRELRKGVRLRRAAR